MKKASNDRGYVYIPVCAWKIGLDVECKLEQRD